MRRSGRNSFLAGSKYSRQPLLAFLDQKRTDRYSKRQNQQAVVADQRQRAQLFVVPETAAHDFQFENVSARHRGDENEKKRAGNYPRPSQAHARDQQGAERHLEPGQTASQQFDAPERQQIVGIDGHAEKEMVIAKVPATVEVKFGVRSDQKNQAKGDAAN